MNSDDFKFVISKLDKIDGRMDKMNETLIRNTISLEDHIARTNLLEAEIKPIKKIYSYLVAGCAVIGAIIAGAKILYELGLL